MIKIINFGKDKQMIDNLMKRWQNDFSGIETEVSKITKDVRDNGDIALKKYSLKFDNFKFDNLMVSEKEIEEAVKNIDVKLLSALKNAIKNIEEFHGRQKIRSYKYKKEDDIILGQIINPIEKIGVYVPGGTAAYPSTLMMNVIPAKIAGVEDIIIATPPDKDGKIKDSVLTVAYLLGINKLYKMGGAQAIAAMAYGTELVPKVDKIVGPGNIYVALAKKKVSGVVGIDMMAGPSEILIIADEFANPKYIAADMISQAEHDPMAASIVVTDSEKLIGKINSEIKIQMNKLERKEIIEKSLSNHGAIIITSCKNESFEVANQMAPEHVELLTKDPFSDYKWIKNAGAIFLGEYTPEPVGDYYAGPNHTLPTSSTAKFSSALSVTDFYKKTSLLYYSKEALMKAKDDIVLLSKDEKLTGHANSILIRFGE